MGKPTAPAAPADPFLAPFFEAAVEHVWGGLWNRPGLELKYRSLVTVSALAATGHTEELKPHLRGALNLGWTADELREALLQTAGYVGFSAAHEALDVLSAIVTQAASAGSARPMATAGATQK